ncbi:MAG: hypothetical protein IAG13_03375 [Deltaproteobacteria bacterium]|nr:hypothetical protein [Nannocystaceae bacterium]
MSKSRRIAALVSGLTVLAPMTARAELAPEVPPPEPWPSDPAAEPSTAEPPPPGVDPTLTPVLTPTPMRAVPPPPAFNGRGLLIAAYAVTGFSWVSRLIGMGIGLSLPANVVTDSESEFYSKLRATAAFTAMAPIAQLTATGLIIPGGVLRGRSDGYELVTKGAPVRNGRALLVAGAVMFGVFTATSIALRPAVVLGCGFNPRGCDGSGTGGYVGYMLGVQASDTLSTAGAGMMSYGIAYQNIKKTYAPPLAIAPFSSRGAYGISLSGRF